MLYVDGSGQPNTPPCKAQHDHNSSITHKGGLFLSKRVEEEKKKKKGVERRAMRNNFQLGKKGQYCGNLMKYQHTPGWTEHRVHGD